MDNVYNYKGGSVCYYYNPDTVDFMDGYIEFKVFFSEGCEFEGVEVNGRYDSIKYSLNDDNLFMPHKEPVSISEGDILHIRYNVSGYESPLDVLVVFNIVFNNGIIGLISNIGGDNE